MLKISSHFWRHYSVRTNIYKLASWISKLVRYLFKNVGFCIITFFTFYQIIVNKYFLLICLLNIGCLALINQHSGSCCYIQWFCSTLYFYVINWVAKIYILSTLHFVIFILYVVRKAYMLFILYYILLFELRWFCRLFLSYLLIYFRLLCFRGFPIILWLYSFFLCFNSVSFYIR